MSRRRALLVALAAAASLTVVARVQPSPAPPLYDGVCIPDPYRTVGSTPAPTSVSKAYPASGPGEFQPSQLLTPDEDPAQVQVFLMNGTFVSSQPFSVSVTPLKPDGPGPADGTIDGNVYRIVATTASGSPLNPVDAQHPVTIQLRATSMDPPRTMERLDGSSWTPLKTFPSGCGDAFTAAPATLGDFALVLPRAGSSGPGPSESGGVPVAAIAAGGTAVVLVVLLTVVRLVRGRAR